MAESSVSSWPSRREVRSHHYHLWGTEDKQPAFHFTCTTGGHSTTLIQISTRIVGAPSAFHHPSSDHVTVLFTSWARPVGVATNARRRRRKLGIVYVTGVVMANTLRHYPNSGLLTRENSTWVVIYSHPTASDGFWVHGREWRSMITVSWNSERSIASTPFVWAGRYRPPSRGTSGFICRRYRVASTLAWAYDWKSTERESQGRERLKFCLLGRRLHAGRAWQGFISPATTKKRGGNPYVGIHSYVFRYRKLGGLNSIFGRSMSPTPMLPVCCIAPLKKCSAIWLCKA